MAERKAPTRKRAASKKRTTAKKGRTRSRKGNVVTIDFEGVESGGAMPTPDGPYTAELTHAEQAVSSNGNDMIEVRWKTNMGSTVFDNFTLVPQALWVLRTMLECAGYDIPDAEYDLDVDALIGIEVGLDIVNETFDGKDRPKIAGYLPMKIAEQVMAQLAGEDADDAAPGGLQGATPDEEEEYEDEDDEDDDEPEDDEDDEEEPAPKRRKSKAKTKKAATKKKKAGALRPGARVTFDGEDDEEMQGVIEFIEDGTATVIDDEEGEWEIPLDELTKA